MPHCDERIREKIPFIAIPCFDINVLKGLEEELANLLLGFASTCSCFELLTTALR
jgi:hypothetical protein